MTLRVDTDGRCMGRALSLARRAEGFTRPNPAVGAVLTKNGQLLGEGWHHAAGMPHAEIEALADCWRRGNSPRGATLYVTLEPCSTTGRTPPCVEAIVAAGVARVVIGTLDPNPRHAGRALRLLNDAGVATSVGVREDEARDLLAPFAKWITTRRPFVSLKMAQSVDSAIADADGRSKWISCERSRSRVQLLRSRVDAVMVGVNTVLADDPSLLCRGARRNGVHWRVVMDTMARTPLSARVLSDGLAARTIVATALPETLPTPLSKPDADAFAARRAAIAATGATVWSVAAGADGRLSIPALLDRMGESEIMHVLCEGGSRVAGSLLAADAVDALHVVVAPLLLGDGSRPAFSGFSFTLDAARRLALSRCERIGPDVWLTYRRGRG